MLVWVGARARYVLAIGCLLALFLPFLASTVRPALPILVSMVLALSMARIDLGETLRAALRPRRLTFLIAMSVLLMPVTGALYALLGLLVPEVLRPSLIYLAAAPPIASSAGLCFLLGFNARLAVEVTVAATLLTPVLGVLTVSVLLPDAVPLSGLSLAMNLSGMIALGIALAVAIRWAIGPARIAQNGASFDGIAALGMLIFVIPLFDGVGALILDRPYLALLTLILGFVFNLGVNVATRWTLARRIREENAGAAGVLQGNRTVAMYLAALPPDPVFTLFVALYQFPMYFTPLLTRPLPRSELS